MIVPITRKEKLLNAIATNGNVDFSPKTREEIFLFKILGADVNTPTPITRKEILYQHIIDGTIPTFEPRKRLEKFIMAAAGVELELPVVLTREEYWWAEISDSAYKTITGAIVHFISKRARAIKSLIANISYTQDLNGYDSPWPSGGGKNKFNGTFLQGYWAYADGKWVNSPNWITTEKIPCKASTSYTVSADAKVTRWQGFVWYDSNGDFISTDNLNSNVNIGLTKTSPSNAAYLIFNIAGYPGSNDTIAPSDVTHFQLEEGSSSTAYAPYSNICPISGWTGANVQRTGKNLLDKNAVTLRAYLNGNGDVVEISYESWVITDYIPVSGTFTISNTGKGTLPMHCFYDEHKNFINSVTPSSVALTLSTPNGAKYIRLSARTVLLNTAQLELGSTATAYEPYAGNTYSITFPSEAGTVYGGTVDVTTGKLTVTHGNIVSYAGESLPGEWISDRDVYSAGATPTTGAQVVYELATPQTYQLTPTEVATLLGDNTIWADTGDVTVTY